MRNHTVLIVLMSIVSLTMSECMLRIYAIINRDFNRQFQAFDLMSVPIRAHGEVGYRQKPNAQFEYANGTVATSNGDGYRGPIVEPSNPSRAFRIVLLGGSTTHGWKVNDDQTIDAYMRELLAARYADRTFEVINLAFDGYDSTQLVERFTSDGLLLNPDLVIINTGINDVRNTRFKDLRPKDVRTVVGRYILEWTWEKERLGRPAFWSLTKHYLYTARFPGFVRHHWEYHRTYQESRDIVPNPQAIDIFKQNLRKLGAMVHAQGGILLYSNPPSSLKTRYKLEDTSASSYWIKNAATTQELRDRLMDRTRIVVSEFAEAGWAVSYVPHALSDSMFIDDCHLTPEGNQQMAIDFIDAIEPFLQLRVRIPEATVSSQ